MKLALSDYTTHLVTLTGFTRALKLKPTHLVRRDRDELVAKLAADRHLGRVVRGPQMLRQKIGRRKFMKRSKILSFGGNFRLSTETCLSFVRQFFKRGLGANFMPRRQLGKAQ
jgi:hypothetical protein